jgi:tripartite-type tricarboxylate transporter receptor subunit TctC
MALISAATEKEMPMGPALSRRGVVLGGLAAAALSCEGRAAAWPERPITLEHGFGAGGNADVISRIVAEQLTTRLGQPVVVEPKPGAGGRIAAAHAAKAPADGYTLAVLPGGHAIAPAMFDGLPYDTVNDFAFVSMLTDFPFILATYPDHPVKTVADLIAAARRSPSPMIYGSAGNGTGQHLSGALFTSMATIQFQHLPFRGGALGSTELLGRHIDFLFETPTLLMELIRGGQLRAVAVTGRERFFALPDVPTIGETVAGYETSSWLGLAGPAALPADIVARLHAETTALIAEPAVTEKLRGLGNVPSPTSPEAFKARVAADVAKWTRVVADAGIKRIDIGGGK